MTLTAVFNGQPIQIVVSGLPIEAAALTKTEAAKYLGVSVQTIWRLAALGKIKKTSYGTYPIESLNNHLREEMQGEKRK